MKLLIVSNLYPPYIMGGYELGCARVAAALRQRGHQIKVLTSTYGAAGLRQDGEVHRLVPINFNYLNNRSLKRILQLWYFDHAARRAFLRLYAEFQPDAVYFWNMRNLPISLVFLAQSLGLPTHFYISDAWLSVWERDGWHTFCRMLNHPRLPAVARAAGRKMFSQSRALFAPGLRLDNVHFVSNFIQQGVQRAGKAVGTSRIIRWGVDEKIFRFKPDVSRENLKLLYAGQIVEHKGVHILIEALRLLVHEDRLPGITLTLAGSGFIPAYVAQIKRQVAASGLAHCVAFRGMVAPEQLPALYAEHDVLVFSSIWEEPFSIALVEAMAAGLGIVTTMTGGTPEIAEPGRNVLAYDAQNPRDCADQVRKLWQDRGLLDSLRHAARRKVAAEFRFDQMVDKIELALQGAKTTVPA